MIYELGLPHSTKRENVYNDDQTVWLGTRPINVMDLGSQDATTILKYELLKKEESVCQSTTEGRNTTTEGRNTTTVKPTLYNTKAQAKKDHDNSSIDRPKPDS